MGDWSDEDLLTLAQLRDSVRQAQQDQVTLQRDANAERKRLNEAQKANHDAAEARLQAELGGTLRTRPPPISEVKSNDNLASRRLQEIEARWQEAQENEKDGLGRLRQHYFASNRRAAKAVIYREFEEHALKAINAIRRLNGMQADMESAGAGRLVYDTWRQAVIPCEPSLAGGPREYVQANMADWLFRSEAEPSSSAQKFLNRSRLDFERLLGGDIKIDWSNRPPTYSPPPVRVDQIDRPRGSGWGRW